LHDEHSLDSFFALEFCAVAQGSRSLEQVFTMGGMRTQQSWGRSGASSITSMSEVDEECQNNFVNILERALELGINHFETARGYGCSELQYGDALRLLFARGIQRKDIILQTKVSPFATPKEFRETLDLSLSLLGVDYIDLFAFHGINTETKLEWTMRQGGCMEVAREYQRAGKLRWIGFSTHAMTPLIIKAIETDAFDYVNL
jgi:predicted aldo/keto reductase-like oxidoreductase